MFFLTFSGSELLGFLEDQQKKKTKLIGENLKAVNEMVKNVDGSVRQFKRLLDDKFFSSIDEVEQTVNVTYMNLMGKLNKTTREHIKSEFDFLLFVVSEMRERNDLAHILKQLKVCLQHSSESAALPKAITPDVLRKLVYHLKKRAMLLPAFQEAVKEFVPQLDCLLAAQVQPIPSISAVKNELFLLLNLHRLSESRFAVATRRQGPVNRKLIAIWTPLASDLDKILVELANKSEEFLEYSYDHNPNVIEVGYSIHRINEQIKTLSSETTNLLKNLTSSDSVDQIRIALDTRNYLVAKFYEDANKLTDILKATPATPPERRNTFSRPLSWCPSSLS